jgi:hypothetical protein
MSSSKAEISSEQQLQNPKTLQTYSDFKKTLSDNERENFLNFVRETTHNLEKPINDLEAWLAHKNAADQNRWEVYYKNYQQQKTRQKSRNTQQNSGQDISATEKSSAIALWQKRLKEQQASAEAALRKSHPYFQRSVPESELENSLNDDLNDFEGAANDRSSEISPDDLKSEFDEILGNSAGFTKDTSPASSPETPSSPKISIEEGMNFLHNLGMLEHFALDSNQEREEEQERDFWQDTDSDQDSEKGGEGHE